MGHIPLAVLRISADEQELIHYFRLLPPAIKDAVAYMIASNIPTEPSDLIYSDRPRLVSSK